MHREKDAHHRDRHEQHRVVHGGICATGEVEQRHERRTDHSCRQQVHLDDLSEADPEQPQNASRLLIERIGQQAAIAIDEQRLSKARPTIDRVHHKDHMRQIGHQRVVHAEPERRELPHRDHAADKHDKGSYDNPPRRPPEKPLVSLDEQLIQVFKTFSLACDARIHTDALPDRIQANALQGDRMGHDRILQQLLTHRGIVGKGQYLPQCRYAQKGTCDHTGHSHCHRNHESHEWKGVCDAQQQEHHDPQRRCISHLAMHQPALFIIP